METVCARRALDATPVENRLEHFPSQMIWIMWTRIVIGPTKHEIIGADILGAFEMLHQDTLERSRHMPDVLLAGLRRILQPASPKTLSESYRFCIPINVLPLKRQQFPRTNASQRNAPEEDLPADRHFLKNVLDVPSTPNRHLLVSVLWPMQLPSYRIVFDQIVRRCDFEHGVQQLINVQNRLGTEVFVGQTSEKLTDVGRRDIADLSGAYGSPRGASRNSLPRLTAMGWRRQQDVLRYTRSRSVR